jgi:hypothetical protein
MAQGCAGLEKLTFDEAPRRTVGFTPEIFSRDRLSEPRKDVKYS